MTKKRRNGQAGFTFIEMLIVTLLSVILAGAAASLFFTAIVGNTKKDVLTLVKNQGDFAMGRIEFSLRNAVTLIPNLTNQMCQANMTSIGFKTADEKGFIISNSGGRLALTPSDTTQPVTYLTSTDVILSGPTFDCQQVQTNSGTYVTIRFSLTKDSPDFDRAQPLTELFTTSVNIRSY